MNLESILKNVKETDDKNNNYLLAYVNIVNELNTKYEDE